MIVCVSLIKKIHAMDPNSSKGSGQIRRHQRFSLGKLTLFQSYVKSRAALISPGEMSDVQSPSNPSDQNALYFDR